MQDNCKNPYYGVDDAGGCGRGCLGMMLVGVFILAILVAGSVMAFAHENHTWTLAQRKWFQDQKSPKTGESCCNENDGSYAEEDIRGGIYWTRWPQNPSWMPVPPDVVIRDPNRNGAPVVWWWYENGITKIRCYAPGGGV